MNLAERAKMVQLRIGSKFSVYRLRQLYQRHGIKKKGAEETEGGTDKLAAASRLFIGKADQKTGLEFLVPLRNFLFV